MKDRIRTLGAVDVHFHGAFGIDLMTAGLDDLNLLAKKLGQAGLAAFCPTTLSVPFAELREAVRRLGAWISEFSESPKSPKFNESSSKSGLLSAESAIPLGIHLEGPYISPGACGAHPTQAIRKFKLSELETLWEESRHTLKILTLAPELLTSAELSQLARWAFKRSITLSLGHSQASEKQAESAFSQGIQGVTHAWNAMPFHHRAPGSLGAALGRPDIILELILDQIHVSRPVLEWTRQIHGNENICYVSDCVPAAATRAGSRHSFGRQLKIQFERGACRLETGELAGGGVLLPEAFCRWISCQNLSTSTELVQRLSAEISSITTTPLRYLGMGDRIRQMSRTRAVEWIITSTNQLSLQPHFTTF